MVPDSAVIKHVIQQHQVRGMKSEDDEDVQRINIRRSQVLSDSLRQFRKTSFNVEKLLKVCFIGEEAVDAGGPRREFFHLLVQEIFTKSGLFGGFPDHVVVFHDAVAIANNTYYIMGKMIATCVIQGGEAPACFANAVADYLVYGEVKSPVCLDDIPMVEIRSLLQQVMHITNNIYSD